KLTSHLAHEETDALPLLGQLLSDRELAQLRRALRGQIGPAPGGGAAAGPAARTLPWALAHATPALRTQVLGQLPAPARLLYRTPPPRHCDQNPIRPPRQHPRLAPPPRQGIGPWCAVESSGGGITVISGTLRRLPAARGRARRCIRSGQRVSNWVK